MQTLAERAASGDCEALSELVRLFYPDVFRFASRIVGSAAAEDATQETFLVAARQIRRFKGDSSVKTWLLGIAANVTRNMKRKQNSLPLADWDYPSSADPTTDLIEAQALREALGKLSPEHREVVFLHEMDGLTYEECAKALNIPEGTVKSRLYHAFRNLRSLLGSGATT